MLKKNMVFGAAPHAPISVRAELIHRQCGRSVTGKTVDECLPKETALLLSFRFRDLIFSVTVAFVTFLGVHSVGFVRRLSNKACETVKNTLDSILIDSSHRMKCSQTNELEMREDIAHFDVSTDQKNE